jgi:hypothetical protein
LLGPSDGVCGGDSLMVSVEIANYGQNTLNSLSVSVDIFGTTMTATPTNLGIPFGGKDTVELGYASNYVGGIYAVTAYTVLTNDGRSNNDTLSTSIEVSDAQQVSPVYPDMICAGDDITLSVTIPTQGNVTSQQILRSLLVQFLILIRQVTFVVLVLVEVTIISLVQQESYSLLLNRQL